MTRDRSIDRVLDRWFLDGPSEMPDRLFEAVLDQVERTPQRRLARLTTRYHAMPSIARYAAVAAAIILAAAVGWAAFGLDLDGRDVGDQQSPAPSLPASPSPTTSSAAGTRLPIAPELKHPFLGPLRNIARLGVGEVSNIDLRGTDRFVWETGVIGRPGGTRMVSTAYQNADGELELTTTGADTACRALEVGRYPYRLSPGGSFLTIEPGTDECAVRLDALPGEWLRSDCRAPDNWCLGHLEPGAYSSQYFDPRIAAGGEWAPFFGALTYDVPAGWANAGDWPGAYTFVTEAAYEGGTPLEGSAAADGVTAYAQPTAASREACAEIPASGVATTPGALAEWLLNHEGLIASEAASVTIDGRAARVIDLEVEPSWTATCDPADPFVAVPLFVKEGDWHAAIAAGDRQRVVIADLGGDVAVVILIDTFEPDGIDAYIATAMPVIETFAFSTDNP